MLTLHLFRSSLSPETRGRIIFGGQWDSLELPWMDNQRGKSCIPPGRYLLEWAPSPRLKRHTLRLVGVPNRDGILIHPANYARQLAGCIALGTRRPDHPEALIESRKAVQAVEERVRAVMALGESVYLEIHNP